MHFLVCWLSVTNYVSLDETMSWELSPNVNIIQNIGTAVVLLPKDASIIFLINHQICGYDFFLSLDSTLGKVHFHI